MTTPQAILDATNLWQDDDTATKYALAERATAPYAGTMIQNTKLAQFIEAGNKAHVLDLACGTGVVTAALYDAVPKSRWDDVKVLCGDGSESMLKFLKGRAEREGWVGVRTEVVDRRSLTLTLPPSTYTHLFINFAIFALPPTTLTSCLALVRPGGAIAISSWAYLPWYPFVQRAVARMPSPPSMPSFEELRRVMHGGRDWHSPGFVEKEMQDAGVQDVRVVTSKVRVDCGSPAQFCDTIVCLPFFSLLFLTSLMVRWGF
ncbi:S-adenosyl-L-methionine-dependent methyltransferase [Byssothecium circinans]|uniref:S-adenosyl-L-methionine-dependent methyltransferase n=1 Tax=Byssothecium circinans TaxID=147558 RepID=A0A6A5TWH6_9PLEO|nr:S-adenosyl-L-methionine-dependent methyltransferase [Byssothecium circinans]